MRWLWAILLVALPACGGGSADDARPNVLIITVDTLRADRLGCYGYGRDTTPELDAFRRSAILFEQAYSQAPFTAPSHASLFTSLHSNEHGVLSWGREIPAPAKTLAERFAGQGWRTGAFYNHPTLEFNGIERGFEHVEKRYFEPADATIDGFLGWASEPADDAEPFCAWVHLWDVHRPYGYRDWSAPAVAKFVQRDALAYEEMRFGSYADVSVGRTEPDYNVHPAKREARGHSGSAWAYIDDRYDGGVWYADRALGELFDGLRERGLFDSTIVIVTSDHGESLRERDAVWFTHDPFLYEETLRVPLLVRLPGGERGGETVTELARGIDVLPTLLHATNLSAAGTRGRSLLTVMDQGDEQPIYLFAQTQTLHAKEQNGPAVAEGEWHERREVVSDGRRKLYVDRNLGRSVLFDLEADSRERRDVSADPAYADDFERLTRALDGFRALPPAGTPLEALTPEALELLKFLGYAGE